MLLGRKNEIKLEGFIYTDLSLENINDRFIHFLEQYDSLFCGIMDIGDWEGKEDEE